MDVNDEFEEYIKTRAILFAEWLEENCIDCISAELKYHYIGPGTVSAEYDSPEYDLDQLYNLFMDDMKTKYQNLNK